MSILPIAKTFGKIAPGCAGAELPDDRLHEQPVALVAVAPDMAGAAWKQMFNSCKFDRRSMHSVSKAASIKKAPAATAVRPPLLFEQRPSSRGREQFLARAKDIQEPP